MNYISTVIIRINGKRLLGSKAYYGRSRHTTHRLIAYDQPHKYARIKIHRITAQLQPFQIENLQKSAPQEANRLLIIP